MIRSYQEPKKKKRGSDLTVGTVSGDSEGDVPGDAAAGIRAGSPCSQGGAAPLGGHFWVLADARSDEEEEDSPIADQSKALMYVSNSDLSDCAPSSARRLRRDRKRMQRWAAKELAISPSVARSPSSPEKMMRHSPGKKLPVLEPSTFLLEEFNANEWITVFHRERKNLA
jgi:hypothetical protein